MQTLQATSPKNPTSSFQTAADAVRDVVQQHLMPKVSDIDLNGEYPTEILHLLGQPEPTPMPLPQNLAALV